jgi:tetratricopeptide (TPR) repeat protein
MTQKSIALILAMILLNAIPIYSQYSASQKIQVGSLPIEQREAIASDASAADLEQHADLLRAEKSYFDAYDYYRAAIAKYPNNAVLYNKLGINELLSQRLDEAGKDFQRSLKLDPHYAEAYNNLGVLEYVHRRYGKAVKQYQKAIANNPNDASYYSNLGTAYFSKKDWKKSTKAYSRAVILDPDVFERTSQSGIAGQISSPEDRAHFSYVLARLYAKNGFTDRSLECLRRAMENGYRDINEVYKDEEFTQLRKDPRFSQLMASRPVAVPE